MIVKFSEVRDRTRFRHLAEYLCEPRPERPERIQAVFVQGFGVDGMPFEIAGKAWRIAAAAVDLRHRSQPIKRGGPVSAHMVVSFTEAEASRLDFSECAQIGTELLGEVAIDTHYRISAIHGDTDHCHLHTAVDLLDEYGRVVRDRKTFRKLVDKKNDICRRHGFRSLRTRRNRGSDDNAIEVYEDLESFESWLRRLAAPPLRSLLRQNDVSWARVQDLLGTMGVELKRRRSGLVMAHRSGRYLVRASQVGRQFAYGRLSERLGEFQAAGEAKPEISYRLHSLRAPELFERFQREMAERKRVKSLAVAEARLRHRQRRTVADRETRAAVRSLRVQAKSGAEPEARQDIRRTIEKWERRRAKRINESQERKRAEIKKLHAKWPLLNWSAYLNRQAREGRIDAIEALRSREDYSPSPKENAIAAKQAWKSLGIQVGRLQCEVRSGGVLVYADRETRTAVVDRGKWLVLDADASDAAVALALTLAQGKFGDWIRCSGSHQFRSQVKRALRKRKLPMKLVSEERER